MHFAGDIDQLGQHEGVVIDFVSRWHNGDAIKINLSTWGFEGRIVDDHIIVKFDILFLEVGLAWDGIINLSSTTGRSSTQGVFWAASIVVGY